MIVGSILLILVAVVLLVLGLTDGSSLLLTGSIAASLLAAVALVVGARQDTGAGEEYADDAPDEGGALGDDETAEYTQQLAMAGARTDRSDRVGSNPGAGTTSPAASDSPTITLPGQPMGKTGYGSVSPGETYAGQAGAGWEAPGTAESPMPGTAPSVTNPPVDATVAPAGDDGDFDDEDPPDEPAPQVVSAADAARVARLETDVLVIDGRPRYHLPGCVHLLGRESEPLPVSEAVELGFTPCSLCEPDSALLADPGQA